jgi:alkylation response protein AidB-like acyl-CoA dehydrogenase
VIWRGPVLDGDQRDLAAMLDAFVADHDLVLGDDPVTVAGLVAELAGLGLWTLGTAESAGGGGADRLTTVVALERLGRSWPALGWAAVQAHAAVDMLAGVAGEPGLVDLVHGGEAMVAVVDTVGAHVRLTRAGDTLTGTVDRVDAASETPYLLVLDGDETAALVKPAALMARPVARTGLGGALTRSLEVEADDVCWIDGADLASVRVRLRLGVAAVAAGIAGAAADAAAEYAAGRVQFGAPLTALPMVRQSLLAQASAVTTMLAAAVATPDDPGAALAAQREACDGAIDVCAAALQSHGGYGYLVEYGAERRLRDAVSLRAATDVQGAVVAAARSLAGPASASALRKEAS